MDFGGATLTSIGGSGVFLARYSSAGGYRWARSFGGATKDLNNYKHWRSVVLAACRLSALPAWSAGKKILIL